VSADPEVPPLVRIHSECFTGDVLRSERCDCRPQVGALPLYLRQEDRGIGLYAKLDAYGLQDAGLDAYDANLALGYSWTGLESPSLSGVPTRCTSTRPTLASWPRRPAEAHARWTSGAMTCSTPRRRAPTARRLLSCHLGRTSRSWWCTVTDRWPAAAWARRRLAYDGAWARSSGRCSHAPASQPVNHAAAGAA
jgi:hypothetical protein